MTSTALFGAYQRCQNALMRGPVTRIERGFRADARMFVGRALERDRRGVGEEVAARRRFVARDFLFDRAAFVLPLRLQIEHVAHAIGLDAQHRVEIGRRHGELVLRRHFARLRVEVAAERGRDRAEFRRREILRAAEHHVFLRVRHARHVGRIVARTHEIGRDRSRRPARAYCARSRLADRFSTSP